MKRSPPLTHQDLKYLATKDNLQTVVETVIDQKLTEHVGALPTKNDFYTRMDSLAGELKSIRESFDTHSFQHQRQDDQLEEQGQQITKIAHKLNLSL